MRDAQRPLSHLKSVHAVHAHAGVLQLLVELANLMTHTLSMSRPLFVRRHLSPGGGRQTTPGRPPARGAVQSIQGAGSETAR